MEDVLWDLIFCRYGDCMSIRTPETATRKMLIHTCRLPSHPGQARQSKRVARQYLLLVCWILVVVFHEDASAFSTEPLVHKLSSSYQSGETLVRVLLPDRLPCEGAPRLRTVYVLPVEAGEATRWGNPLTEIINHDLHNRYGVACVIPSFSSLPWYANHPDNRTIYQEAYLLQEVLPLIEQNYPVRSDADGRLLAGFSKSGWGAWSLLLRHPDVFGRAAAFDAPLMMDAAGKYGSGPIFGTDENFKNYQLTRLLEQQTCGLTQSPARLLLSGRGNFHSEHLRMLERLQALQIAHHWIEGPKREHSWHSGWLPEAFEWLTSELSATESEQ